MKQKKNSCQTLGKILLSAKQSYDTVVKENNDLKAYIEKLRQHFQQQQVQFLKEQKNYYRESPKKYKRVTFQEESESEPEIEEEEQEELESEQIEKLHK